jgi:hypothetical protein
MQVLKPEGLGPEVHTLINDINGVLEGHASALALAALVATLLEWIRTQEQSSEYMSLSVREFSIGVFLGAGALKAVETPPESPEVH